MANKIEGAVRYQTTAEEVLRNFQESNPLDRSKVGSMEIGIGRDIDLKFGCLDSVGISYGERVAFFPKTGESFISSFFVHTIPSAVIAEFPVVSSENLQALIEKIQKSDDPDSIRGATRVGVNSTKRFYYLSGDMSQIALVPGHDLVTFY